MEKGAQSPDFESMEIVDVDRLDRAIQYLIDRTLKKYAGELKDVNQVALDDKNKKLAERRNKNK